MEKTEIIQSIKCECGLYMSYIPRCDSYECTCGNIRTNANVKFTNSCIDNIIKLEKELLDLKDQLNKLSLTKYNKKGE